MKFNECLNWLIENKNYGKIKIVKYQEYSNYKELFNKYLSESHIKIGECLHIDAQRYKYRNDYVIAYQKLCEKMNSNKAINNLIITDAHLFEELHKAINPLANEMSKFKRELDIVIIGADGADYDKIKNHITAELECDSLENSVASLSKEALSKKLEDLFYKKPCSLVAAHNKEKMKMVIDALLKRTGEVISSPVLAKELGAIDQKTVDKYIKLLTENQIVTAVNRYDINKYSENGNNVISKMKKYYAITKEQTHILFYAGIIDKKTHLENQVLIKLKDNGFDVYAGKFYTAEVDFVAVKESGIHYFHIATDIEEENEIIERYRKIRDNYPKIILTSEKLDSVKNRYGIIVMNIEEWLKEGKLSDE